MRTINAASALAKQLAANGVIYAAFSVTALAHDGKPHTAADLWYTWGLDPFVIGSLAITAGVYARGLYRARSHWSVVVPQWEVWAFALGWLSLVVALVSPLHPLGEVLFSAHMTQHEILMLIAAPLFVLARPLAPLLWGVPASWRQAAVRATKQTWVHRTWVTITNPLMAWATHAVTLWIWHTPSLFDATLRSDSVHTLQHLSFLGTALLFWWALIHGGHGLLGYGAAVLYVFTTSVHSSVLGALITFAESVWYPSYAETTFSWGLSPLEDQQLGGLIMWVPAATLYIVAGLALMTGWIRESERRVQKGESKWFSSV